MAATWGAVLLSRRERLTALPARPIRFALVGVANTVLGLLVIYAAKWVGGLGDFPANLLGYIVGLTVSYFLNARWTFAFRGRHGVAAPRFMLVILVAYLANIATVYALLGLAINGYIAQAAGIIPYTVVGYLGAALFAFRGPDPRRPASRGDLQGE
jgi:putative flippase GtrA